MKVEQIIHTQICDMLPLAQGYLDQDYQVDLEFLAKSGNVKDTVSNFQAHLFDSDTWPPILAFVQDTQANCARWIDIWLNLLIEQRGQQIHGRAGERNDTEGVCLDNPQ